MRCKWNVFQLRFCFGRGAPICGRFGQVVLGPHCSSFIDAEKETGFVPEGISVLDSDANLPRSDVYWFIIINSIN